MSKTELLDLTDLLHLGSNYLDETRYLEAEEIYRQIVKVNSHHAWANCNLGRALWHQGKIEESILYLRRATELEPGTAEHHHHLGNSLLDARQLKEAEKTFRAAINLNPNKFIYYHQLASSLLLQEKYDICISYYQKALELEPNHVWSYCNLGSALIELGRWQDAVNVYLSSLQQISGFSDLISKFAIAQRQVNESQIQQSKFFPLLTELRTLFNVKEHGQTRFRETTDASIAEEKIFTVLNDTEFIRQAFSLLLNRSPGDSEIELYLEHFKQGSLSRASALESILMSEEFGKKPRLSSQQSSNESHILCADKNDLDFVQYLYTSFLKRDADKQGLDASLEALRNGVSRSVILENIIYSDEFKQKQSSAKNSNITSINSPQQEQSIFVEMNDAEFIEYTYVTFLKHLPSQEALTQTLDVLEKGASRSLFLENLLKSAEFHALNNREILGGFSDHEFLHIMWEVLFGVVCNINAERSHLKLFDSGLSRSNLVLSLMKSNDFLERIKSLPVSGDVKVSTPKNSAHIMGTDRFIDQDEWNHILLEALLDYETSDTRDSQESKTIKQEVSPEFVNLVEKSGLRGPVVSIITSLYKGEKFIKHFMKNITAQTIFDSCELIIIDANSPENEYEVIQEYMKDHQNIHYIRTDEVIGIYDAWNLGVKESKGKFLTNANLDDLRSFDCLEKQAIALLKAEDFDVVYQDVYYTFTPNLPFDVIAKCGVRSKLPMATKANMLQFNSPHNAPMWRKLLHKKVGLFNTRYKSAGDYELWLRAMLNGSKFLKIEEPLAAYYNNPFGISTRSETSGVKEAIEIQRIYVKLFGASFFSMPKNDFIIFCYSNFGLSEIEQEKQASKPWQDKETFLYQVFNEKLRELSEKKFFVSLENL